MFLSWTSDDVVTIVIRIVTSATSRSGSPVINTSDRWLIVNKNSNRQRATVDSVYYVKKAGRPVVASSGILLYLPYIPLMYLFAFYYPLVFNYFTFRTTPLLVLLLLRLFSFSILVLLFFFISFLSFPTVTFFCFPFCFIAISTCLCSPSTPLLLHPSSFSAFFVFPVLSLSSYPPWLLLSAPSFASPSSLNLVLKPVSVP